MAQIFLSLQFAILDDNSNQKKAAMIFNISIIIANLIFYVISFERLVWF